MEGQQTVVGEGTVVALVPGTQQVVIDHEEIEGFMGAMTMGFRVHAPSLLDHVQPGDGVRFTINTATGTIIALEKLTP
jgi:Cu/Ag efflux protein CusF